MSARALKDGESVFHRLCSLVREGLAPHVLPILARYVLWCAVSPYLCF